MIIARRRDITPQTPAINQLITLIQTIDNQQFSQMFLEEK